MKNTLIIYETAYGTAKKAADIIALILGNSKSIDVSCVSKEIEKYDNIVLVFSFHGFDTAKKIKEYLSEVKDNIINKKIAIIGVGLSEKDINNYVPNIEMLIGKKTEVVTFVQGELIVDKLFEEDKKIIKEFFKKKNKKLTDMGSFDEKMVIETACRLIEIFNEPKKEMDRKELMDEINKFIKEHNTCTLATGSGDFIRNTPIEHIYYKNNFYFITEGGMKFKGILQNQNVCIAIFNEYTSMNNLKGLQISGKSTLVPYLNEEYVEIMEFKGVKIDVVKKLPINLNLIKVVPNRYEFLNTDFKAKGFESKQYYFPVMS